MEQPGGVFFSSLFVQYLHNTLVIRDAYALHKSDDWEPDAIISGDGWTSWEPIHPMIAR